MTDRVVPAYTTEIDGQLLFQCSDYNLKYTGQILVLADRAGDLLQQLQPFELGVQPALSDSAPDVRMVQGFSIGPYERTKDNNIGKCKQRYSRFGAKPAGTLCFKPQPAQYDGNENSCGH